MSLKNTGIYFQVKRRGSNRSTQELEDLNDGELEELRLGLEEIIERLRKTIFPEQVIPDPGTQRYEAPEPVHKKRNKVAANIQWMGGGEGFWKVSCPKCGSSCSRETLISEIARDSACLELKKDACQCEDKPYFEISEEQVKKAKTGLNPLVRGGF
jgi:hypothetical protein